MPPSYDWGIVALGDAEFYGTVGGRVLVQGTANLHSFSVAADDAGQAALVGDRLLLADGQVYGDAMYISEYTADSLVNIRGNTIQGAYVDVPLLQQEIYAFSQQLAASSVNGSTLVQSWGTIELTGTDPGTNVFSVNASDVSNAVKIKINVPAGASVIVNVSGDPVTFSDYAFFLTGVDIDHLLFNLPDAKTVDINAFSYMGTLLAPYADLTFDNAKLTGNVVVHNITGNLSFALTKYSGVVPCP